MDAARAIRQSLKILEVQANLVSELRTIAKTDGGHMTEFGRSLLQLSKRHGVKQAFVAKLLDISPGAASQHYNK